MSPPRITVTAHPAADPIRACLSGRVAPVDAEDADGLVLAAAEVDAASRARAALAEGRVVLLCGRPADLDGLRAAVGGGLLLVADPPWLLVAGAETRAAVIDGWDAAAWALLAAAVAHRGPAGEALTAALAAKAADPGARADGAFVHPTAVVEGEVELGRGTTVWHFSKLLGPLRIGAGCSLGQNVVVERHVTIGDNVRIQNNVSVYSGVILEDDVFCGPSMVFTNVGTPRSHYPRRGAYQTTRVGRGASIGANATVICGTALGAFCFVGAGAVVTRDVPAYGLVYGNPARLRGWACYCGARLQLGIEPEGHERTRCGSCDRAYVRDGHKLGEEER